MKRETGGQGEFSVGRILAQPRPPERGRIFGAATPPGALVHVKKVKKVTVVTVLNVFAPHALACRRKVQRDLKIFSDPPHCRASGALKISRKSCEAFRNCATL